jgi:hypothetical protein
VFFTPVHSKREIRAEELADLAFRITLNFKSAAACGSLRAECGKNEMAPWPECPAQNSEIALAIIGMGEKVKNRPVVPDRKLTSGLKVRDVGFNPGDMSGKVAQAGSGMLKSARSDVKNGDVRVA